MRCRDCDSRKISWNIDSGYVIAEYDEEGNQIDFDFHCDSLNQAQCAMCDSTNLDRD